MHVALDICKSEGLIVVSEIGHSFKLTDEGHKYIKQLRGKKGKPAAGGKQEEQQPTATTESVEMKEVESEEGEEGESKAELAEHEAVTEERKKEVSIHEKDNYKEMICEVCRCILYTMPLFTIQCN